MGHYLSVAILPTSTPLKDDCLVRLLRQVTACTSTRGSRSRPLVLASALLSLTTITIGTAWAASPDALRALERTSGALGVVVPCHDVQVSSEIGGVLAEVKVHVGDRVRQGAILFRLDDTDLRHRVEVARASLQSAEADVARARAALEVAELAKSRRERRAEIFSQEERERCMGGA